MKEQVFGFKVTEDKEIKVYRKSEMQSIIKSLDKGEYEWVLRKKKKKRSLSQNSYYWGIVIGGVYEGLVDNGYTKSELDSNTVHEYLKTKFLTKDIANDEGEFISIVQDTSKLSTSEFMDYIAQIQMWAATFLNYVILDPNTQADLEL
jgi:L-cysteine desulfidase